MHESCNALHLIGLGEAKVFENQLDVLLRHRPRSISPKVLLFVGSAG
jgi:hypothetical protein